MSNQIIGLPEIQVSYKLPDCKEVITRSYEAYDAFMLRWNVDTIDMFEEFMVLYLTTGNAILGHRVASRGGISSCIVDPKVILAIALKSNSSGIILGHNHPSGKLKPSEPDIRLTKKLINAAEFLDIKIFDHIILTSSGYYSFADEGEMDSI